MKPGDLAIRDLGYSNTQVFIDFEKKGVYFVSRLKSDLKVYIKNENDDLEEFDLDKYLSKMKSNLCELEVYLKKDEQELRVRLIIEKVPQEIKESRLRKLKEKNQKKGRTTSKRSKLREGFTLYISNVPEKMIRFNHSQYESFRKSCPEAAKQLEKYTYERTGYIYIDLIKAKLLGELTIEKQIQELLLFEEVVILAPKGFRQIYSVRWQIELIFKNWKSNFDLEEVRVKNNENFAKCLIYAKLMYILISMKITFLAKSLLWKKERKEVSELQAGKHLKMMALTWMFFAIHAPFLIENMLRKTVKYLMSKCVKSKKKGALWPLEILQVLFLFI